ncbi:anti-phage ZorAB system protein ZorA [Sphingomonas sp. UYP23]
MDKLLDQVLYLLGLVYFYRWVVPFVILPIMLAIAGLLHWRAERATRPFITAARRRASSLVEALGPDQEPAAEREAFSRSYIEVSQTMSAEALGADPLVQAWREFQESIVDEDQSPIRNTSRPTTFFIRVIPRQTTLTFASNIFVGVGLVLTFLGLIVALNTAARGMSGGGVADAQLALTGLLTVAGAKFFSSVAGLVASIWLRTAEHSLSRRATAPVERICDLLERGLLYIPPQRLAVEQLEVLREQRDQLKFFNTDVALQLTDRIGEQFRAAMAPVTQSLGDLNSNMTSVTQGIGAGAREAIEKVSGEQLRGLSDTLASLRERLDDIGTKVGSSGSDAAEQIKAAGSEFSSAARDIRDAFDKLVGNVDGLGQRLTTQGEESSRAQDEAMARIREGLEGAQARTTEMMERAVAALQAAGRQAAEDMQRDLGNALASGVARNQETFRVAMEESGEALRETSAGLARAIAGAADGIERAGANFARSSDNASKSAGAMGDLVTNADRVSSSLRQATEGLSGAAAPVLQASRAVGDAANRVASAVEASGAAEAQALREMRELADGVKQTHAAAEGAWRDYRARFEGVDRAMAETADRLAATLGESLTEFRRFAQDTDREMAAAIGKLATTVSQIEEYAEALDEFVEQGRGPRLEPAE